MTQGIRGLVKSPASMFLLGGVVLALAVLGFCPAPGLAEETPAPAAAAAVEAAAPALTAEDVQAAVGTLRSETNLMWIIVAGALVFFMQCGFGMLEGGLIRSKNVGNTWMKGVMDFCVGSLVYWAVGFGIMFGDTISGFFGCSKFFVGGGMEAVSGADFGALFFQTAFAGAAATIMAGAMAERLKFSTYLVMTVVMTAIIYPIVGHWIWGNLPTFKDGAYVAGTGSWLHQWTGGNFIDFAGSSVVHSVGGWASLAGCLILGPRIGKFRADGSVNPTPGHNLPMAAVGTFILWLGWFGFNPGSTLMVDGGSFATVAVTTNLAAAAGACTAMFTIWIIAKKPDISMTLNGALAGLVAVTAGCYNVSPVGAAIIGSLAGILVVCSVLFFDKLRIDDPVGAISVHGANGIFGTLAVGLFAHPAYGSKAAGLFYGGGTTVLVAQIQGILAVALWTFPICLGFFFLLKKTMGVRVSESDEIHGLDLSEHGNESYAADFGEASVPPPLAKHATDAVQATSPRLVEAEA